LLTASIKQSKAVQQKYPNSWTQTEKTDYPNSKIIQNQKLRSCKNLRKQ